MKWSKYELNLQIILVKSQQEFYCSLFYQVPELEMTMIYVPKLVKSGIYVSFQAGIVPFIDEQTNKIYLDTDYNIQN